MSSQIRYGSKNALNVQPLNEGNLYFVQDGNTTDLYADLKDERVKVTDKVFKYIFNKEEEKEKNVLLQSKVVVPSKFRSIISADQGYDGLYCVEVKPIPDKYEDISKIKEQLIQELTEELTEKITKELTEKITNKIKEETINSFDNSIMIDSGTISTWIDNE